jgi:Lsr2
MAQKVSVLLVDDIDGSDADETVKFGLDGTHYEIDLNGDHAQELRGQLSRYVRVARKVTGSASRPTRGRTATENDARNKEIRDWARERNLEVNDRGRIPAGIVAQFEAATGK